MRLTASSEVPKYLTVVWQPVAFSNGVTQSVFGSLVPSSAYPGHARTLTAPSLVPSFLAIGTSGAVKPAALFVPPLSDDPQLVTVSARAPTVESTTIARRAGWAGVLMRTPPGCWTCCRLVPFRAR